MKFGVALSIVVLHFCGSSVHAASAPQAIRVAYTSVTGNRAPFWIAKEAKLFEKHGLQVERGDEAAADKADAQQWKFRELLHVRDLLQ